MEEREQDVALSAAKADGSKNAIAESHHWKGSPASGKVVKSGNHKQPIEYKLIDI